MHFMAINFNHARDDPLLKRAFFGDGNGFSHRLTESPAVDGNDMIGDPHRRLPVRYESDRLPGAFRLERFQDDGFVEAVEIAGRLVQEEERRVVQKRAGQSEPLAFAAGQCIAEFADRRIVSFRERQDEVMYGGHPAGSFDFGVACVQFRNAKVVSDTVVEKVGFLRNKAFNSTQIGRASCRERV